MPSDGYNESETAIESTGDDLALTERLLPVERNPLLWMSYSPDGLDTLLPADTEAGSIDADISDGSENIKVGFADPAPAI